MAEEQKPVEVAAPVIKEETAPVVVEEAPAVETAAVAVVEDKPAEEAKPAEAEEAEAAKEEDKKEEEVKPVEEGFLGHKAQGASFPKNLIASKTFFFFGNEAVETEVLAAYKKAEKHVEVAQHNIAWAAHTGRGLLFIGDKKAPHGIINLADATEPETDGSHKFHLSAKGNKHTFKANSPAERDNWVAQLKERIAEAKELAATVTESELYKQTIESLKPAAKEDKVEPAKDEATPAEEAAPKADEPAAEEETAAKEETKDELKVEEPKRRSASRKRTSFFGFGKKEEKKDEAKTDEAAAETPVVVEPVIEVEAPAAEEAVVVADAAAEAETKPAEEAQPESPKEKPAVNKRTSFFGNVFSKKEKKATEVKSEAESPKEEDEVAATTEAAPVIPPVEATTPLAVDVSSPATVPTETTEAAVINGESKKDKEKRKSSLPFTFGKRDKSPGPGSEGEEKSSKGAFSKLRATIKGKGAAKSEDKPADEAKEGDAIKEEEETPAAAAAAEEAAKEEELVPKPEEAEAENKPEAAAAAAPVVTAAA
ncbi:Pleckstrin homology domain-containing protein [Trichoderma novae-zelandiae]